MACEKRQNTKFARSKNLPMKRSSVPAIKDHLKLSNAFTKLIRVMARTFQATTIFSINATNVAIYECKGPMISLHVKKGVTRLLFKTMPIIRCVAN